MRAVAKCHQQQHIDQTELQHTLHFFLIIKHFVTKANHLYAFHPTFKNGSIFSSRGLCQAPAGGNGPLAPHMGPCAPRRCFKWIGYNPLSLRMNFFGGLRVCIAFKALLCSGNDESPHHWSVLRAIHTLNSPKNYTRLLGRLLPIHKMCWRGAQGHMWGTRGPFLPAAVMVGNGCVGLCWPLEANVRLTYCRNSKNCLRKFFFNSYVYLIHSWHLTQQLNKEDLDLRTCNIS